MNILAWTLIHFLWQGALVCAAYLVVDLLLQNATSRVRYTVACLAMLLLAIMPGATFIVLAGQQPASISALPTTAAPWISFIVWGWASGVAFFTARFLGAIAGTRQLRKTSAIAPAQWQQRTRQIAVQLRVLKPVQLLLSASVAAPITFGWLRPVILLPAAAVTQMPADLLEALIVHELAHIRRADYLINWLQNATETILFYHPAVWWLSRRVRELREFCCDDCVLEFTTDRGTYARALIQMEELRIMPENLALAATGGPLRRRIERILNPSRRRTPGAWLAVAIGTLVLGCSLLISAAESPQDKTKEETEKRSAYAKAHFGGLEDERSKTYIKYGPPDEMEVHPGKDEKWMYHSQNNKIYTFDLSAAKPQQKAQTIRELHDSTVKGFHNWLMSFFHGSETKH